MRTSLPTVSAMRLAQLMALLCGAFVADAPPAQGQNPAATANAATANAATANAATANAATANAATANAAEKTSPWQFDFSGARGLKIERRGVAVVRRSSLYVVKPGWSGLLFDQRAAKQVAEKLPGGGLRVRSENENFVAQYELRALDDSRFELRFRGELKRDVPAEIELAAGYFNANLLANRPFRATQPAAQPAARNDAENGAASVVAKPVARTGVVPVFAPSESLEKNDLAPGFEALEFDSRVGRIRLETDSPGRVVFADARRETQNWAKEAPVFWCGWLAGKQPLRFGAPVSLTLTLTVLPPLITQSGLAQSSSAQSNGAQNERGEFSARLQTSKAAVSVSGEPVVIVPRPQSLALRGGAPFRITSATALSVLAPRGEDRLHSALAAILREEWSVELAPPRFSVSVVAPSGEGWCRIVLGGKRRDLRAPTRVPAWALRRDAYRLTIDGDGIEISAPTARGAFYGIQTLSQVLRPSVSNSNLGASASASASAARLEIEDFAALEFRGAHWFPSASGVPFHRQLIRAMARLKMNAAVIQCEAARWDSHPEIAAPNSISKADLRALVTLCRANFIEPIPLINTPGHAEWMFRNGQNLDLAEDPQTPYAYAVNNPESQKFVAQILSEAIEVFHPRRFHLGHDEVTLRGRFPNPQNPFARAGQSAGDLVMENLRLWHDWLRRRGIETWVWSDMFLHPDEAPNQGLDAASAPSVAEARRRRQQLPADVTVVDWHYGANAQFPSLKLFANDHLRTVAATWNTPQNIRNFARQARENGAFGLLQTTWAGYFPDASVLDTQFSQFSAFVLAGDYAWSGRDDAPDALPYDPIAHWNAFTAPRNASNQSGNLVDLSPAARTAPTDWLGLGPGQDLGALFKNGNPTRRFARIEFEIPARNLVTLGNPTWPNDDFTREIEAREGLIPAGAWRSVSLKIGARAEQIALLHAALWSVPDGTVAARMSVEYADLSRASFDLTMGKSLVSWQSEATAGNAQIGWQETLTSGQKHGLRVTRWQNPFPEKTIARIEFTAIDPEAGYVLAALTLLDQSATG